MKLTSTDAIGKEQFLLEHNRLSPSNLQVTFAMLTHFQEEVKPTLKDDEWSNKLRIPLILWLFAAQGDKTEEKAVAKVKAKKEKQTYRNYPETH